LEFRLGGREVYIEVQYVRWLETVQDRNTGDIREGTGVFGKMLEEFCDGEEDSRIVFFDGPMLFDAEYAGVDWFVDIVGAEMAFGDKFLTEADPAVAVDAGAFEESVFFDVVPAYFVGAFHASG
jgi:hypothetical protein